MRRLPWDLVLALLTGLVLGLAYAWMISPLRVTDANPADLRADFKDQYRSAIAAAFAANGNLPRAQARLLLLKDADTVSALNAQAQRMLANGEPPQQTDQVAALARVLEGDTIEVVPSRQPATEEAVDNGEPAITATLPPPPPEAAIVLTETPVTALPQETQVESPISTLRPTQTPLPTLGAPFVLTGQDEICDANLPVGLLQVIVMNASRRQMPGMEILIAWEGGEEQFFTGLKPELGNGYADFLMAENVSHTVQLAAGSDIASGLVAPTCQAQNGETFRGGIKLTFQQP